MPVIEYHAPLNVLVAVRGHPFDRTAFDDMFLSMPGISATMVDQPAAAQLMNPHGMAPYQALLLYDMPGLDFSATENKPAYIAPPPALKSGLQALLAQGKGIVALHHALAGWPAWPEYAAILGGAFRYRADQEKSDSGYRHDVDYTAENVAPAHPVMAGIPTKFALHDELYLTHITETGLTPLLRAHHSFTPENFYSAQAAMHGNIDSNTGWHPPPGSNLLGWTKKIQNAHLVYLQPGHDHATYTNPTYRRLVENALRFVASPQQAN